MHRKNRLPSMQGYLSVCLAAGLWATSGSVAKSLFTAGVTPFQLVQLRTTIASTVLVAWMVLLQAEHFRIRLRDIPYFVFLGSALAATQFTYLYAISKIQVAAAILLQYQAPVLIAAYVVLIARQRLSASTVLAVLGAASGCYLLVGAYSLNILSLNRAGIIAGISSGAAFAVYTVTSEYGMRTYNSWTVLSFALVVASVLWNLFHPPFEAFVYDYGSATRWLAIVFIAVFGTILPFGLYNRGIAMIRSTRASVTATLEPLIAGVISYHFLGETMEPLQLLGAGVVIVSVVLLQISGGSADG